MFQGHIFSNKQCSSGCLPFSAGCAAKSAARCIPYVQVAQQKQSSQHMSPEEIFQIVLIFNFDIKNQTALGILSARRALGEAASPFWITRDPLPQNWPPARKHARRHVLSREQRRQGVMQYDNAGCAARCKMHGKMHTVSPGNKQRQSRQTKPLGGDFQISSNEAFLLKKIFQSALTAADESATSSGAFWWCFSFFLRQLAPP